MKVLLGQIISRGKTPKCVSSAVGSAYIVCLFLLLFVCLGKKERKLGFSLFASTLAGKLIYSASASDDFFMSIKTNFFGFHCGLRKTALY